MTRPRIYALASVLALAACGGGGGTAMNPMSPMVPSSPASGASTMPMTDTDTLATDSLTTDQVSILKGTTAVTIGSTVDPINGAVNPYGLAIAPESSGTIQRGDLVVCNFNDNANVQGTGESIIALSPQAGSQPRAISESSSLLGCNALTVVDDDAIWTADFASQNVLDVSASGAIEQTLMGSPFANPFGMIAVSQSDRTVLYATDATNGTVIRITSGFGSVHTDVIASGFAVNGGAPGSILGPSGLAYHAQHDRLYVVDGTNNTVVALRHVSTIPAGGVVVNGGGTTFGGPFHHRARLVYSGAPLNGPISSALLPNGNLAVGNTLDPNGSNLIVELTPNGKVLDVDNVDTGASGAIFGMVASGTRGATNLYFNDDNANAVVLLHN